jgi:hypothetical protein
MRLVLFWFNSLNINSSSINSSSNLQGSPALRKCVSAQLVLHLQR